MAGKRYIVVVNPVGGDRRGKALANQIEQLLRDAGNSVATYVTSHRGHAAQIAEKTDLSDCDALCAVGGDGTLHQVASGLLRRADIRPPPLGIIPAGTGNSVLNHLGLCDPQQAVRRILSGRTAPLDAIRVSTTQSDPTYCVNLVGWGILSEINQVAERLRLLGRCRYAVAALSYLFRATARPAKLTIDGETIRDDFLFVVACNTRTIGSGMQMAPQAEIDDGRMDVVAVRRTTRRKMLTIFRGVFSGNHVDMPEVEYTQASEIRLESDAPVPLNLDGEIDFQAPFSAVVVPGALEVLV